MGHKENPSSDDASVLHLLTDVPSWSIPSRNNIPNMEITTENLLPYPDHSSVAPCYHHFVVTHSFGSTTRRFYPI